MVSYFHQNYQNVLFFYQFFFFKFIGPFPINYESDSLHEEVELSCCNIMWFVSTPKGKNKNMSQHVGIQIYIFQNTWHPLMYQWGKCFNTNILSSNRLSVVAF